jgi:hypothetical protein
MPNISISLYLNSVSSELRDELGIQRYMIRCGVRRLDRAAGVLGEA